MTARSHRLALAATLALGAALRLPWLASRPLWLDEALQHHVASGGSVGGILRRSAADLTPPTLALLQAPLLALHDAAWVLRLPSFLAGLGAILAAAAAGRAWGGERAALPTALIVACCPPAVAWSREGRPYAVALLALTVLLAVAGRIRRAPGPPATALLTASAVAAAPWHPGAWLVIGGILGALALEPATRRAAATAGLAAGAVAVSCLVLPVAGGAPPAGLPAHLAGDTGPSALILGLPTLLAWLLTGSESLLVLPAGLALLAAAALLLRRAEPALRAAVALPLAVVAVAALLGLYPLGPLRHDLVLLPGLAVLAGVVARLPAVVLGSAVAAVCAMLGAPGLPVHDTPTLLALLADHRDDEPVWVHPMLGLPARHYGPPDAPVVWGAWSHPEIPPPPVWTVSPSDAVVLPADAEPVIRLDAEGVTAIRWDRR